MAAIGRRRFQVDSYQNDRNLIPTTCILQLPHHDLVPMVQLLAISISVQC